MRRPMQVEAQHDLEGQQVGRIEMVNRHADMVADHRQQKIRAAHSTGQKKNDFCRLL